MGIATLLDLIVEGASSADPAKLAVVSSDGVLTYRTLIDGARGIAATLLDAGVARGDRVGIWMEKTPAAVQSLLGVMLAGAAYVPLDPRSPWQRCRNVALDCGLAGVILDAPRLGELARFLEGQNPRLLVVEGGAPEQVMEAAGARRYVPLALAASRDPRSMVRPSPEDLAYILYTSGSTGTPKGVVHTHASGGAFDEWDRSRFGVTAEDVFSSHAPFHFDLSISDLFVAFASGATVRLLSTVEAMLPRHLVRALDQSGITVWYSVPSVLVSMLEAGLHRDRARELRLVLFAGEVFPTPQLCRLRRALPRVSMFNLFGPTETNVCTYYEVPDDLPDDRTAPIPIGRGCEHLETFVVADDGSAILADGREGTLWVRGGNVMSGYWNDPERTRRVLQPDPRGREGLACCTGDQVRLLPNGEYEFLGRRDHMVKTRGYRVELGEIEAALVTHPAVLEAVATAIPDPALGNRIVASAVLRDGHVIDGTALVEHCAELLPIYMVPESIEIRSEMPRTSTGKADRRSLRGQWEGRAW